jgi:hypothetical protein
MACLKVDGLKRLTLTTRLFRLHCINGRPRSRFGMMGWTAPPTLRFTDRVASGQYRPQSGHSSENPDGPMEPKVGNRPCSSAATSLLQNRHARRKSIGFGRLGSRPICLG